ncbi:MAG TPA: hypothetical protein VG844_10895 [Terracidiphilus sp.]|nr:hypothetical protein [Terracidiphilus sp.]
MPQYEYSLYLFLVSVFEASRESNKKPAWLWKQETGSPAVNFTETVVFDDRLQMFLALENSGLLNKTQLADADRSFRESGFFNCIVYVPSDKTGAIVPNLSPEPGIVIPSGGFQRKLEEWKRNRK